MGNPKRRKYSAYLEGIKKQTNILKTSMVYSLLFIL